MCHTEYWLILTFLDKILYFKSGIPSVFYVLSSKSAEAKFGFHPFWINSLYVYVTIIFFVSTTRFENSDTYRLCHPERGLSLMFLTSNSFGDISLNVGKCEWTKLSAFDLISKSCRKNIYIRIYCIAVYTIKIQKRTNVPSS